MLQGGSFWTAFGSRFGGSASSGIDEILEREHCQLEDLLDHDDVIQECKYMNAQLIDFLSTSQSVEKLVRYVITIPSDDDPVVSVRETHFESNHTSHSTAAAMSIDEDVSMASVPEDAPMTPAADSDKTAGDGAGSESKESETESPVSSSSAFNTNSDPRTRANFHKYPYVASELFACEVVSMLDVLFECTELLDLLFSFLDHPAPMDPSHASYFRKVMVVLIQRKYEPLVGYIQEHSIIDKLVKHIGLYSIMEILIMIGWDDGLGQVNDVDWLYNENLIPKLVAKLTPEFESQTDVHMNAARALVDVVVKCPPSQQNVLIAHLQSTEVLNDIFHHMFSGSMSSLTNSMSIIIVLVQRFANRRVENGEEKTGNADNTTPTNAETAERTETHANSEALEEPFASLAPYLHKIIALLKQPQQDVPVQFGRSQPFGETRMKVVELTLVLLRSRLPAVDSQLSQLRVLSLMLDAFFDFPWNNMLHGLVESIVRTVLDSESIVLRKALFEDANLTERFVDAYHASEKETQKPDGYRLGYMGHLIRTAMAVEETARKSDETRASMQANSEKWQSFVANELEREHAKQQQQAPFVQGEEDILDGLQFDIAGMSTDVNAYMGSGGSSSHDEYGFNDVDDDNGGNDSGLGYDYTNSRASYTIRDPDTDYDDNGEPIHNSHSNDDWSTSNDGDDFGSGDDWGSFSTQFPTSTPAQSKDEFDRPTAASSSRTLGNFGGAAEEEEESFTVHSSKSETTGSAQWPPSDDDFDADFNADFAAAAPPTSESQPPPPTEPAAASVPVDDFETDFSQS